MVDDHPFRYKDSSNSEKQAERMRTLIAEHRRLVGLARETLLIVDFLLAGNHPTNEDRDDIAETLDGLRMILAYKNPDDNTDLPDTSTIPATEDDGLVVRLDLLALEHEGITKLTCIEAANTIEGLSDEVNTWMGVAERFAESHPQYDAFNRYWRVRHGYI